MCSDELSEDVRIFVAKYVWTFEELQILARASSGGDVDLDEIAIALALNPDQLRIAAAALRDRGLLVQTGSAAFRFEGMNAEVTSVVTRLIAEYEANPVSVVRLLSSNSLTRLRAAVSQAFRKPEGKGTRGGSES
jgi:hypothetical protein